MRESKRKRRQNGNIITTWFMGALAFILIPMMPGEALAQSGSCNSNVSVNVSGPSGPWHTGDQLTASATFTAWPSDNSNYVDIPDFGYGMACKPLDEMNPPAAPGEGVTYYNCQWSGHKSIFQAGIVVGDGCVNPAGEKIKFLGLQSQLIDLRPTNGPIRVAEGKSCTISWGFEVDSVVQDDYDLLQVVSFPLDPENDPAKCQNGISTQQSREFHVTVAEPSPDIKITKSAEPEVYGAVGQKIVYSFNVTNVGNDTLDFTKALTDANIPDPSKISCTWPDDSRKLILLRGETVSCDVDYFVTQADLDRGFIYNKAITSATGRALGTSVTDNDDKTVNAIRNPLMKLEKTVSNQGSGAGGKFQKDDVVKYGMTVTNIGNVTLTNVRIDDSVAGLSSVLCASSLAPLGTCSVNSGAYTVMQADIDNNGGGDGDIDNTATASSTEAPNAQGSAAAPLLVSPSMDLKKSVTNTGTGIGGSFKKDDVVKYGMTVTNKGNVTLTDVRINDPLAGVSNALCSASLAPAANCSVNTGTYKVLQSDIDNNGGGDGDIDNTATASSKQTPNDTDSAEAPLETQGPSMDLEKTVTNQGTGAGDKFQKDDVVKYGMTVTNKGNVTLTNVRINDPVAGVSNALCSASLAPGANCSVNTGTYKVTQTDIDNNGGGDGDIDNTATASSNETPNDTDSAEAPLVAPAPSKKLEKTVTNKGTGAGDKFQKDDVVKYGIKVTNTGNVTLTDVRINDAIAGLTNVLCSASLAPTATCSVNTGTYTVTQADINNNGGGDGDIDNTAKATSKEALEAKDSAEAPLDVNASMKLDKTVTNQGTGAGGKFQKDDVVNYGIKVTNTGNVTLTNVRINDSVAGLTNELCSASLAPAASCSVNTGTYKVLQSDINDNGGGDGDIDNTAKASSNETKDAENSAEAPLVAQDPKFEIEKEISIDDGVTWDKTSAGPVPWPAGAWYRITVENTGNVDLPSVIVSDKFPGVAAATYGDIGPLLVGEKVVITPDGSGDLTWLALDVAEVCDGQESITNLAKAVAAWSPTPIEMTNDATLICDKPAIKLVKEVGMPDPDNAGQYLWFDANNEDSEPFPWANVDPANPVNVRYRFKVSNVSEEDVDLLNVVISDPDLNPPNGFQANVGTLVWNATPVIVPVDNVPLFENRCNTEGLKTNLAKAEGVTEFGTKATDTDPATVRCADRPAIMVTKQVSADGSNWSSTSASGLAPSNAFFRFIVTNTGDSTLGNLVVADSVLTISTADTPALLSGVTLAKSESITLVPGTPGTGEIYWEDLDLAGQGYCNSTFSVENSVTATGKQTITGQVVNDTDTATFNCTLEEEEDPEICYDESTGKDDQKPYWIKLRYDADSDTSISAGADTTPIINGVTWNTGDPTPAPASFPSTVDIFVFQHNGGKRIYWSQWRDRVENGVLYIVDWKDPPKLVPSTTLIEIYGQCETNTAGGTQDPDLGCGAPLQTIEFHTSCSQDMIREDEMGAITLVSGGHEPM